MEKRMVFIPNFGFIRLKLEKTNIVATEVPKELEGKFKEKYPDGIIGDIHDWAADERFGQVLTRVIESLR
ncbi:MAG: hypothetical protein ABSE81_02585 [Candidatus Omnitrophota bacterium]